MKNPSMIPTSPSRLLLSCALLLAAGIFWGSPAQAQQSGPTPFPDPKEESAWPGVGPIRIFPYMNDNRKSFWTKRDQSQGALVFVGDSILGNWGHAKVTSAQSFPQIKLLANRAIGGSTSRDVLFCFQEDVLDLHPEAIVLLVGSNDRSAAGPLDATIANITALLDLAQKANPAMPIILCTLPPQANPKYPLDLSKFVELNQRITELAQGREHVTLVDTYPIFALPDGKPDPALFRADLVHPNEDGYAKLAIVLAKVFADLKLQ